MVLQDLTTYDMPDIQAQQYTSYDIKTRTESGYPLRSVSIEAPHVMAHLY